jgi:hypothetical protein
MNPDPADFDGFRCWPARVAGRLFFRLEMFLSTHSDAFNISYAAASEAWRPRWSFPPGTVAGPVLLEAWTEEVNERYASLMPAGRRFVLTAAE